MELKEVKFDCRHFRGDIPCQPNKLRGKCCTCDEYVPVSKRILIIKLGALGDVIRSTALLPAYRKIYPDCRITWLTNSPEILPQDGTIDLIAQFKFNSVFPILNQEFDIAVNLDKDKEACALLSEISAKKKYGFTWGNGHLTGCNDAADRKIVTGIFDEESKKNKLSYPQEIFDICELKYEKQEPLINLDKALAEKWNSLKKMANGKRIIGLNTGCGSRWLTRLFPDEHWLDLITLLNRDGYFPIILGGPDEDRKNKKFAKTTGAYYPGTFSLPEFIALTANCDLVVTAVSMMMHIAIALKVPIVLFNNIFNRNEFELYGRGKIVEPRTGCDCFYGGKCTRKRHCMEDLEVKDITQVINAILPQAKK